MKYYSVSDRYRWWHGDKYSKFLSEQEQLETKFKIGFEDAGHQLLKNLIKDYKRTIPFSIVGYPLYTFLTIIAFLDSNLFIGSSLAAITTWMAIYDVSKVKYFINDIKCLKAVKKGYNYKDLVNGKENKIDNSINNTVKMTIEPCNPEKVVVKTNSRQDDLQYLREEREKLVSQKKENSLVNQYRK